MSDRIVELSEIMRSSTEFAIRKRIALFDYTRSICDKNRDDLLEILTEIDTILNVDLEDAYYSVIHEITRRFLNAIGTEFLFIEFMSRENNRLETLGMAIPGYNERVTKTFAKNETTRFVKQLRNHAIHFSTLDIKIVSTITPEQDSFKSRATLDADELLKDSQWNQNSRRYISRNGFSIDLRSCMQDYYQTQYEFYSWFRETFSRQFQRELKYCEEVISEWNQIMHDLRTKLDRMTFQEKMALPQLKVLQPEGKGELGYSIDIVKSDQ